MSVHPKAWSEQKYIAVFIYHGTISGADKLYLKNVNLMGIGGTHTITDVVSWFSRKFVV